MSRSKPALARVVRLSDLVPDPNNTRTHPERSKTAITSSIRELGAGRSIVVDSGGVVRAGNGTLEAAKAAGITEAVVVETDGRRLVVVKRPDWSSEQSLAYAIADNRTQELSHFDPETLRAAMRALAEHATSTGDTALVDAAGFDEQELKALIDKGLLPGPTKSPAHVLPVVEDEVPEPPKKAVAKIGDVWTMGRHRIACGGCEKQTLVQEVLGDGTPRLLVTDPPYGVELDMEWRDRAGHNSMAPAEKSYMKRAMGGKGMSGDTQADWSGAFGLVKSLEVAYVWHATSHTIEVAEGLQRIGFELKQMIVWSKTVAAMSRQHYHWKHEPCWYAVRKGKTAQWLGGYAQTTVWELASPKHIMSGSKEEKLPHPTQKPIECMAKPIRNHEGDVYDPFLGSGTTLIAAEQLDRTCYGAEIEPRYCDVVVERWQNLTGGKATRVSGSTR